MVIVWISLDNRRARRAKAAAARKAGRTVIIVHADAGKVREHTGYLVEYLTDPDPKKLEKLLELDLPAATRAQLIAYMGGAKVGRDAGLEIDSDAADSAASSETVSKPERVLQIVTRNLLTTTPEDQQVEMALTAGMAPGVEDPIEHLVISWPGGIEPTADEVEALVDLFLRAVGMEQHQLFSVVHGDTSHPHLHLALNRVDLLTCKRVEFGRGDDMSVEVLHQALALIADRFKWPTAEQARYWADATGVYDTATNTCVRDKNFELCVTSKDWGDVRAARKLRQREDRISAASRRFELRTGFHSLERIALFEAAPVIDAAKSWQEIHNGLARLGLELVLKGDGAVLRFGDRTCSASTAGSGCSRAKLEDRLGNFQPPHQLPVFEPFVDRIFPDRRTLVLRERKRRALRAAEDEERAARDLAAAALAKARDNLARAINGRDWTGDGTGLNDARKTDNAPLAELDQQMQAIDKTRRQRRKRLRALLKLDVLGIDFIDEDSEPEDARPCGVLIGPAAVPIPNVVLDIEGFDTEQHGTAVHYKYDNRIAFVEHPHRIDLYAARNETAIRGAMRVAAAKWGKVVATGDKPLLDLLARIAAEENIDLVNPELQAEIKSYQAAMKTSAAPRIRDDLESHIEGVPPDPPMPFRAVIIDDENPASTPRPNRLPELDDYDPAFRRFVRLQYSDSDDADGIARQIVDDENLAEQLAELDVQGFKLAHHIKTAANRADRLARRTNNTDALGSVPSDAEPSAVKGTEAPQVTIVDGDASTASTATGQNVPPPDNRDDSIRQVRLRADAERQNRETLKKRTATAYNILKDQLHHLAAGVDGRWGHAASQFLVDVYRHPNSYFVERDKLEFRVRAEFPHEDDGRLNPFKLLTCDPNLERTAIAVWRAGSDSKRSSPMTVEFMADHRIAHTNFTPLNSRSIMDIAHAVEQPLAKALSARPLLREINGIVGADDPDILAQLGGDAVGILTHRAQVSLRAALRIQEEERADLLAMIADEGLVISPLINRTTKTVLNREDTTPAGFDTAMFARFKHDFEFAQQAFDASQKRDRKRDRQHPAVRAFLRAQADGDAPLQRAIARQIGDDPEFVTVMRAAGHDLAGTMGQVIDKRLAFRHPFNAQNRTGSQPVKRKPSVKDIIK
jgi:hypothetical protein